MGTRSLSILLARDRMCAVLAPLLGDELARERANNIAQVLAIAARDPEHVAHEMLRRTGLGDVAAVAEQVARAWCTGVREQQARAADRGRDPAGDAACVERVA